MARRRRRGLRDHAERLPPGSRAFLATLADYPDEAQTLLVEIIGAGPRAMERRDAIARGLRRRDYIDETTPASAARTARPRFVSRDDAFAIIGAIVELASRQLRTGAPGDVRELEPVDRAAHARAAQRRGERTQAAAAARARSRPSVTTCRRCPRLVAWREQVAREKRAAFARRDVLGPADPGLRRPGRARARPRARAGRARRQPHRARSSPATARATSSSPRCTAPGFANQPDVGRAATTASSCTGAGSPPPCAARRRRTSRRRPSATTACRGSCASWRCCRALRVDRLPRRVRLGRRAAPARALGHRRRGRGRASATAPSVAGRRRGALLGCFHPSQQNTFTGALTAGDARRRSSRPGAGLAGADARRVTALARVPAPADAGGTLGRTMPLAAFTPGVRDWFARAFAGADGRPGAGVAGDRHRRARPHLRADRLGQDARRVPLGRSTGCRRASPAASATRRLLYVSPLKALAYDVERNLRAPLRGIARPAPSRWLRRLGVAIRTGDTPQSERRRCAARRRTSSSRRPSRSTSCSPRRRARCCAASSRSIVDEIHAVAATKRGAHLALTLERLAALSDHGDPQRIGLSATQNPLEEVARFMVGPRRRARSSTPARQQAARPADPRAGRVDGRARAVERRSWTRSTRCRAARRRASRSGRRSTPRSCASSRSTARRSSSSTTAAAPSASRCASTSWRTGRSPAPTTARSRARSARWSRSC